MVGPDKATDDNATRRITDEVYMPGTYGTKTGTRSSYFTLIAFPRQHWLRKGALTLRHTHISCFIAFFLHVAFPFMLCSDRPEAHPTSYSLGTGSFLYQGVKRPWSEVDHSPPSRAESTNKWRYTTTPLLRVHGADKDNTYVSFTSVLVFRICSFFFHC
jgi:hypothetical protein